MLRRLTVRPKSHRYNDAKRRKLHVAPGNPNSVGLADAPPLIAQ
jgi:hypothetical protein